MLGAHERQRGPLLVSTRPYYSSVTEAANHPPAPRRSAKTYGVKLVRGPFVRLPPHPGACTTERELLALAKRTTRPMAADLFCGAGGLSLGLSEAGFDVVYSVDVDDDALETHRANHPGISVNMDLSQGRNVQRVGELLASLGVTLIAGGPPCQPFSRAGRSMIRDLVRSGRRDGRDERRDLWEGFLGVIEIARPRAVLMENVPDMALDRSMVILRTMIERLEGIGYSVEERIVDTSRHGVPQFRQRLILVALRDGLAFSWPDDIRERVTVEGAIGDLPPVEGGWRPTNGNEPDVVATGWAKYDGPVTDYQRHARRSVQPAYADKIFDHITRPVRDDDALAFAQMDSSTRYSELDESLKRYRDDIFDDKYKRLEPNDLSRTITAHIAKDGYWYIHPYQDRTLTVREAARLQTFPDHFRFAGPPSSAFKQIGNAVPPALAERFGVAILDSLRRRRKAEESTGEVAARLEGWFNRRTELQVPWLAATNRWVVIQGEILWGRCSREWVQLGWAAIANLKSPDETISAMRALRVVARQLGRENRCVMLEETAMWFRDRPALLSPEALASELTTAPHVTSALADLAVRIVPGEEEDPVLAGYGVLRVAARFHGDPVDLQNRLSDGRLAVARMIGGEDRSHGAHLALIELANSRCGPDIPLCGGCPLAALCVEPNRLDTLSA